MSYQPQIILDGRPVEKITAFLFPKGGHENPKVLLANAEKSFVGSYVLGMGFTFDDTAPEATSLEEMQRLIAQNPKNQERIFPYIGGSEVNSSPIHAHHRYAINFFDLGEEESRQWPDLMKIVEEKVKPERTRTNSKGEFVLRSPLPQKWWQYADKRPALVKAIESCDRVLVRSLTSKHFCFTFLQHGFVYDQTLIVFAFPAFSTFATLSCRFHEVWANFFGASLEDRPRYNIGDCFETFPFPDNWETDTMLETIGKEYYEYRAALMIRNNQGLTDTYNRFHDPQETHPEILHLRDLHHQMDRAVLTTYGWDTLATPCGFALDYLDLDETKLPPEAQTRIASGELHFDTIDEATAFDNLIQSTLKTRKKLPWRYRWSPDIHDEILARLLDLNQTRYNAEVLGGKKEEGRKKRETKKGAKPKAGKSAVPQGDKQIELIPGAIEQLDVWSTMDVVDPD
jgi:hypothetical protein